MLKTTFSITQTCQILENNSIKFNNCLNSAIELHRYEIEGTTSKVLEKKSFRFLV